MTDSAPFAAILAAQDAAWAAGDAAAFAAGATDDVVFTNVVGMFSVGRAAFEAQHAHIFATFYKGTTLAQRIEQVTLLRADVAVVNSWCDLSGFGELPPALPAVDGVLRTRLEQVMVRDGDDWRVAAFHNVIVSPQAATAGPAGS